MNKMIAIKTLVLAFVFCLFCATTAFGQSLLVGDPQPTTFIDHVQHAVQHDMGIESNLLGSNPYSYAQGEQPLWQFPSPKQVVPLGAVARAYRKEHAIGLKEAVPLL